MYKNNFSKVILKDPDIIFLTLTKNLEGDTSSPFQFPTLISFWG